MGALKARPPPKTELGEAFPEENVSPRIAEWFFIPVRVMVACSNFLPHHPVSPTPNCKRLQEILLRCLGLLLPFNSTGSGCPKLVGVTPYGIGRMV